MIRRTYYIISAITLLILQLSCAGAPVFSTAHPGEKDLQELKQRLKVMLKAEDVQVQYIVPTDDPMKAIALLQEGSSCSKKLMDCADAWPHLALLNGKNNKIEIMHIEELKCQEHPFTAEASPVWEMAEVGDYDGDGALELMVVYSYSGEPQPAVGGVWYRELAIFNMDGDLKPALQLELDKKPQASTAEIISSNFRFERNTDGQQIIIVEKLQETPTEELDIYDTQKTTTQYSWDTATDTWTAGPAMKIPPAEEE